MPWWFAAIVGCVSEEPVSDRIDAEDWQFPSEAHRRQYAATREALGARYASGTHIGLERVGNFLREGWCVRPGDPEACRRARTDRATLAVLHAPARYPEVFGLVLDANERREALAVDLHWSIDGRTITGDALVVRFQTPEGEIALGNEVSWKIGEDTVTVSAGTPREVLESWLASPGALADRGSALLRTLRQQVATRITSGELRKCVYGDPPGDGRPPTCTLVSLDTAERQVEQQRADEALDDRTARLVAHGAELEALLRDLVPRAMIP